MKQESYHPQAGSWRKRWERVVRAGITGLSARQRRSASLRFLPLLFFVVIAGGCLPGPKPPYVVRNYILEYSIPRRNWTQLDEVLHVRRFSVDQSYNTSAMLYRSEPYRITAYNYNRWRDNPGDIVTYGILRDLRDSGLFRAVFLNRKGTDGRFFVDGAVEEFVQVGTAKGWMASLSIQVTLLDECKAGEKDVVFQKRYRSEMAMDRSSPEAFAAALSRAMSKVSLEVLGDVYESVKARSAVQEAVDGCG